MGNPKLPKVPSDPNTITAPKHAKATQPMREYNDTLKRAERELMGPNNCKAKP